jgi:hypothetical protein
LYWSSLEYGARATTTCCKAPCARTAAGERETVKADAVEKFAALKTIAAGTILITFE